MPKMSCQVLACNPIAASRHLISKKLIKTLNGFQVLRFTFGKAAELFGKAFGSLDNLKYSNYTYGKRTSLCLDHTAGHVLRSKFAKVIQCPASMPCKMWFISTRFPDKAGIRGDILKFEHYWVGYYAEEMPIQAVGTVSGEVVDGKTVPVCYFFLQESRYLDAKGI
jgi:hypothetical protein